MNEPKNTSKYGGASRFLARVRRTVTVCCVGLLGSSTATAILSKRMADDGRPQRRARHVGKSSLRPSWEDPTIGTRTVGDLRRRFSAYRVRSSCCNRRLSMIRRSSATPSGSASNSWDTSFYPMAKAAARSTETILVILVPRRTEPVRSVTHRAL